MVRYIYKTKKLISGLICALTLVMCSMTPAHSQTISQQQATFDDILSRALQMSEMEFDQLSPRMNHLWMASLVDSLQPSVLSELAKTNLQLNRRKEGMQQLQTAFRTSGYDYHLGLVLLKIAGGTQEWALAEEVTDKLLKQKPDDAGLLQLVSMIYEESGQLDRAIATTKKLVSMNSNQPQYVFALANQLIKAQKADEAEQLLTQYQSKRPDELMSSAMLISLWLNQGKQTKAIELLERVKVRFPDDPDLRSMAVSTYTQLGRNDEVAKEILSAARKEGASPEQIEELINVAQQDSPDLTKLLKDLTPVRIKLNEIFDKTPQMTLALANHHFLLRDTIAGERVLEEMVRKGAEIASPYAYFIQKYAAKEDSVNLKKYTEAGLRAMPEEGLFNFYYALLAGVANDDKELEQRVNHAINVVSEEDQIFPQIALMKAEVENDHHRWEEAKKYYEIAIRRQDPMSLNNYAYALLNNGSSEAEFKRAEQLALQATKLLPDDPNNIDTYAWALYKNKAYTVAKIYMENAIDKAISQGSTSLSVFYEHYGEILEAMELYDEALAAWKKALESGSDSYKVSKAVEQITQKMNEKGVKEEM